MGPAATAAGWGDRVVEDRWKVLLRSRWPWLVMDAPGSAESPPGRFVTAETEPPLGRPVIDHLAHTADLAALRVEAIPNGPPRGPAWTDHLGIVATLGAAA